MKVRNSYQKSTIAEAVQINEEKDEMEKPHFLAQDPDLLILDDFSLGLDPGYRRLFVDHMREYAKSGNSNYRSSNY